MNKSEKFPNTANFNVSYVLPDIVKLAISLGRVFPPIIKGVKGPQLFASCLSSFSGLKQYLVSSIQEGFLNSSPFDGISLKII